MTRFFYILCVLLFSAAAEAQTDILKEIATTASGTEKIEALIELSFAEAQSNPVAAMEHANEAIVLSQKAKDFKNWASGLHKLAVVSRYQGLYDQAITYSDSALSVLNKRDEFIEAAIRSNLGASYRSKGMYEDALNNLQQSLDLYQKLGKTEEAGSVLNNLGVLFMYLEDYPKALEYYNKALSIQEASGNLKEVANTLNNFAIVYANSGELDSALVYFRESLEIEKKLGNTKGMSESINNIGAVYYYMGRYDEAIGAFRESYTMDSLTGNIQGMVAAANNIAEIHTANGSPKKALAILQENLKLARTVDSKFDIESSYANMAEAYSKLGDYENAFIALSDYVGVHDTVLGKQQQEAIAEMETRFLTREKEQMIKIQNLELEEKEANIAAREKTIFGLAAIIVLLLIASALAYRLYKAAKESELQRKLSEEQAKRLDAVIEATETERKRIAKELHDGIGQQLSSIKLGLSNLSRGTGRDELAMETLQKVVDQSANDVRTLSHQMMPRALTELGLVPALSDMFEKSLQLADIGYNFEVVNAEKRYPEKIEINLFRIVQESINNILKHARANKVEIQLMDMGGRLVLIVEDDGVGFAHEPNIAGHGLLNIRSRVDSLNGKLEYARAEMGGVSTTVRIPLVKSSKTMAA